MVDELRRSGVSRVVVGGHSLGANVALGYGARIGNVDGIVALAPGHLPDVWGARGLFTDDVARARRMVADGQGEDRASFNDINQDRTRSRDIKARIYLSYWAPDGPAVMLRNAAAMKGMPLFLAIGTHDRLYDTVAGYIFDRAPPHPRNRLVEVEAGHRNTPIKAWKELAKWLNAL